MITAIIKERNEMMEAEFAKDKILADFAEYLLPYHEQFELNNTKHEERILQVNKHSYYAAYELGITYGMGINIIWT